MLSVLRHLQKFLNFSEVKFLSTSETSLLGSPYTERVILHVLIRLSAQKHPPALLLGMCCSKLQYKDNAC